MFVHESLPVSASGPWRAAALHGLPGRGPRSIAALVATALSLLVGLSLHRAAAQGDDGEIARGIALYAKNKCSICHSIGGKGGRVGPALDDAGKKWTKETLAAFLRAPSSVNPHSAMPPMRGAPEEIRAVAAYMMSLGGAPKIVEPEPNIAWGQQLFASKQCFHCHRIGGKGGRLGPALDGEMTRKRSRAFLLAHFKDPAAVTPGSVMPVIPATDAELQSLVFYIESLKPGGAVPAILLPSPAEGGSEPSVVEGEALYHAAACKSCHAVGNQGSFLGPALDSEGSAGRKIEWLLAHFQKPDEVAPGTTMPAVQGTERQLRSLAMYLLSLRARTTPTSGLGRKVYVARSCGYCHGSDAKGKNVGPSLVGAAAAPRTDAWILEHFRDPAAVTPGSVMPRIWAADWELQSLLQYLKGLRK